MRFNNGAAKQMLGKPIQKRDTYFVDLYNAEYSRDAEPVKGAFNDNYYYQLVDNVRKFKGARALPVTKTSHRIAINGNFADWQAVKTTFLDDASDIVHRKHPGWGRIREYVNTTGRNDVVESKVAGNDEFVFVYVRTASPLTAWKSPDWMRLYIRVPDRQQPTGKAFTTSSTVPLRTTQRPPWNAQPGAGIGKLCRTSRIVLAPTSWN